ncbi:helix-turn-helix domain-containing protein [Piscibacillus halophilus]|uniref:Uncharacterized protein YpbB n=1 Tax=Piscibacillus halophilus TaxID=571933 RepID=A0A1H8ZZJ7_9BACI|nr:helix-turn-helix domain-containing protein [Piscibacillus halophilus]SEP69178.1 Uncharacterized protein YpbB [Piscibacillus halophilus]
MIEFKTTLLFMLSRLSEQRTTSAAYHILRGKKSSQTIQDIHLFQLKFGFSTYPKLKKETYDIWINFFVDQGIIEKTNESFRLTTKGLNVVEQIEINIFSKLNGFKFHRIDEKWLASLQLLTQTLSNLSYSNNRFIPVQDDPVVQYQVKKLLKMQSKEKLTIQLKQELTQLLLKLNEADARLFVVQLTGHNRVGLSKRQVAEMFHLHEEDVQLITMSIVHQFLNDIQNNPQQYQLLKQLILEENHTSLTSTAKKTYELLEKGFDLDKIERIRHLKTSTIQDHVVEIATQIEKFDITAFVDESTIKQVVQVIDQTQTRRLKTLMQHLNHSISYFQLRLVLAKYQDYKASDYSYEPITRPSRS